MPATGAGEPSGPPHPAHRLPLHRRWRRHLSRWARVLATFDGVNGWDRGAALAFYALLSTAPLLMLVLAVADLAWTASELLHAIAPVLRVLPADAARVVTQLVHGALDRGGASVWSATAVTLLWSASSWFRAWSRLAEELLGAPHPRGTLERVEYGLRMTATWVAASVGLAALLAAPELLRPLVRIAWLDRALTRMWAWLRWPVVLGALYLAAHALLRTGGRRRVVAGGWWEPGALVTVGGWTAATWGLRAALRLAPSAGWMYGTLYSLVVVVVWCWLVNMAAVLGATYEGVRRGVLARRHGIAARGRPPPARRPVADDTPIG